MREARYDYNQHVWEDPWVGLFGAYDVEPGDNITFKINDPSMTNITAEDVNTAVPTLFLDCGSAGQITVSIIYHNTTNVNLTYTQDVSVEYLFNLCVFNTQ